MKEYTPLNNLNNFIFGSYIDHKICDQLIDIHENNDYKRCGEVAGGIIKQVKDSEDSKYSCDESKIQPYLKELKKCIDLYVNRYPWCNGYSPWGITDDMNIQKYYPGGAFHEWHTERMRLNEPYVSRHLVFMTYLNNIEDDGETEFFHQQLKIKPEKGLTLIWPTDWTFTHRGVPSKTETKYIITGWLNYKNINSVN
jgi:prolyl 4-hydroxylase